MEKDWQFIALWVRGKERDRVMWTFVFTTVYASPNLGIKKELWQKHMVLAEKMQGPWMLDGDFMKLLTLGRETEIQDEIRGKQKVQSLLGNVRDYKWWALKG